MTSSGGIRIGALACLLLVCASPRARAAEDDWSRLADKLKAGITELDLLRQAPRYAPLLSGGAGRCAREFSVEKTLAAAGRQAQSPQGRWFQLVALPDVLEYVEYQAFIGRRPRLCEDLAGFRTEVHGKSISYAALCREWYYETAFIHAAVARSPDFPAVCRQRMTHQMDADQEPGQAEKIGSACDVIASHLQKPVLACGSLRRLLGVSEKSCEEACLPIEGDSSPCPPVAGATIDPYRGIGFYLGKCLSTAWFARAYRSRDARLCGASEHCRVLMGGGAEAADELKRGLKGLLCGAAGPAGRRARVKADVDALVEQARSKLAALPAGAAGAGAPGGAAAQEVRALLGRYDATEAASSAAGDRY